MMSSLLIVPFFMQKSIINVTLVQLSIISPILLWIVYCVHKFKKVLMDDFTFDTDLWAEINDMPGEIYDIEEEKFDVQEYINGNTDYWGKLMRIAFTVMLIMLGCNLMLSILDSNMLEMIESRNEKLEQLTNTNWVGCLPIREVAHRLIGS